MSSRSDADRPPGRSRLVATVILAVAACGLCAAVVGSQDERGHNARLELESADANLIRVLDHSGSGNVHNQEASSAELRAHIISDFNRVTAQGDKAGYLPPVTLHGGGAALSDESFSEPKARAQSLASADWIKSFQSPHSKHTSTTKLGLHKPHKARVLNKMQQVRQAEMEQRMIAKRAAAAKRGLAAHGEKASLGESKTAYAREKQMAASEFASDEAASDKSFFSESQHDKVEMKMEDKEMEREQNFHQDETLLRHHGDTYDESYHHALQEERAKELAEKKRLAQMKKDALEHNDRGAIASPTALSMQQKAQAAEAHHMDEEVDAIMGLGPKPATAAASSGGSRLTSAAMLREKEHMEAQIAAIQGTEGTTGKANEGADHGHVLAAHSLSLQQQRQQELSKIAAIQKNLAQAHKKYQHKLMESLSKSSDPHGATQDVQAAQAATQKFAQFIKRIKAEEEHSEVLKKHLLHPPTHARASAAAHTLMRAEVAEQPLQRAVHGQGDVTPTVVPDAIKTAPAREEGGEAVQAARAGAVQAIAPRAIHLTKEQQQAMKAKEVQEHRKEKQIAAREIAANSAEAAAQQAISTVAVADGMHGKHSTVVSHPLVKAKKETNGELDLVRNAVAQARLVRNAVAQAQQAASVAHIKSPAAANQDKSAAAPNLDKASSHARLVRKKIQTTARTTEASASLAKKAISILQLPAPALPPHTAPDQTAQVVQSDDYPHTLSGMAKWKQLEQEAKAHIAALEKRKAHSLAFMRNLAQTETFQ